MKGDRMLSTGNGRHRRPRPASPAMVTMATTVATGAGIALPLFGATGAQAAEGSTWDKVAVCETGGQWNANTDNGFYGGLAITEDTWESYGGDTYAQRPDLATRAQQIAVAETILGTLGPEAWPGCELSTGLLTDTAPSDVDPSETAPASPAQQPGEHTSGDTGTATPTDTPSATATDPSGTATAPPVTSTPSTPATPPTTTTPPTAGTPSGTATTPPPTSTTTAPPTSSAPPATTAPGGGKHAKPYSPTDDELAAQDQATRTEVYGVTGGTSTTGSTAPSPTSTASTGATGSGDTSTKSDSSGSTKSDEYTVGSGDSLSSIASAQHVDGGWSQLYVLNQKLIGTDPNLIKPGQIINLG
jgi:hypothetical protein